MARRVVVELIGDSSKLERAFARSERSAKNFGRNVERAGRGATIATVGFHGLGRAVASTSAAFLGGYGLAAAAKAAFDEMMRGQAVTADTAAALKSTGSVAGVTAKEIENLGTSLQQMSGYDYEAIRSAENLILTFTNVRNVAGRGNDVFNQTIRSTLDLSRRFDQDLSTSAVQLGKALQDPIRGVTALRRAGVSFSTAQQRTINQLVKTGRLLEAQKLLLAEVRTETGGAAAAYGQTLAGQLDILQGNLENIGGELANVLNPEITKLTKQFNAWLANPENKQAIIDGFAAGMHDLGVAAQAAASAIGALASAYDKLPDFGKQGLKDTRIPGWLRNNYYLDLIFGRGGGGGGGKLPKPTSDIGFRAAGALAGGTADRPGTGSTAKPTGASVAMRNRWFDAMINRQLGRVQDITSLRGQIARLGQIAALVEQRIKATKDITRKLTLEDQLLDIRRTQRQDRATLAEELKQKAADAKAAAEEARRLAVETKFGWLDFAVERAQATKTLKDDRRAYRALEQALLQRIRQEGRTLDLVRDLWRVRQNIRDLNKNQSDVDPLAGLMQVSSKRLANILAAGTGLGAAGRQRLGYNIAGAEIQPLHVHVNIDGREVGSAVTKDQARTGRRTSRQTSGRRG